MKRAEKWQKIIFGMVVMLWAIVAYFALQQVSFESNDDNSMARIAYGMLGYYDYHLVFINAFVGQCILFALNLFPNIPWYTVFQCALIIVSFSVILYLVLKRFEFAKSSIAISLLFAFFGAQFFLKLQFSKTAGISVLAGVLLLLDAVSAKSGRWWKMPLGGILAVFGSMYRFNVFIMLLALLCGVGLLIVWEPLKKKQIKEVIVICVPFVIVFVLCFGFRAYDTWVYQRSEEWIAYKEFNSLRAQLMDYGYPDYQSNKALYDSLGISEADLKVYSSWDFADSDVMTTETLRALVEAKEDKTMTVRECIAALKKFFFGYDYSPAIFVAVIGAFVMCPKKRRLLLLYEIVVLVGVQIFFYMRGRYNINRIDVSLMCAFFVIIVIYCWEGNCVTSILRYKRDAKIAIKNKIDEVTQKEMQLKCFAVGIFVYLTFLAPLINFSEKEEELPVKMYELLESDSDKLYVRTVSTSITRIPRVFEIYPVGYQDNSISLGGWGTYMVPNLRIWENFNVTNPYRDLVDNPELYFVCKPKILEERLEYIRRHYAPEAQAQCVKIVEDKYYIYRVVTGGPMVDTSVAKIGNDILKYDVSAELLDQTTLAVQGYLYIDDDNSFSSNIYIGVTNDAEEELYFVTQTELENKDCMNGGYGAFSVNLSCGGGNQTIRLYLETDEALYYQDIGTINDLCFE